MTVPTDLRLCVLLLAVALVIPACAKKAGNASAPPSDSMQESAAPEAADDGLGYDEDKAAGDAEHPALEQLAGGEEAGEEADPDAAPGDLEQLGELERMLAQREGNMRNQGLWLAHLDGPRPSGDGPQPFPGTSTKTNTKTTKDKNTKKKPKTAGAQRPSEPAKRDVVGGVAVGANCKVVCDLKVATCDLEQKICALAERHRDEPRYAEVCGRAKNDCSVATVACDACSEC